MSTEGPKIKTSAILLMQQTAMQKQAEIERLGPDWKGKIEAMHSTVEIVKEWQKGIFDKFGSPKVYGNDSNREWKVMRPGELAPLDEVSMDKVKFKGATIVQGLSVDWGATMPKGMTHESSIVTVIYKATLMTDENFFLRKMLPKTVKIPVHDPAYTLFDLEIKVPRQELISESIHQLGEIVDGSVKQPRAKQYGRKAGGIFLRLAHPLAWLTWFGMGYYAYTMSGPFWWAVLGVWAIVSLVSAKVLYDFAPGSDL